MQKLKSAIL